jgi:hypothetical protein
MQNKKVRRHSLNMSFKDNSIVDSCIFKGEKITINVYGNNNIIKSTSFKGITTTLDLTNANHTLVHDCNFESFHAETKQCSICNKLESSAVILIKGKIYTFCKDCVDKVLSNVLVALNL